MAPIMHSWAIRINYPNADGWIVDSQHENIIGPDGHFPLPVAKDICIAQTFCGPTQIPLKLVTS